MKKMAAYDRRDRRVRLSTYQIDLICEALKEHNYGYMARDRARDMRAICGILKKTKHTADKR